MLDVITGEENKENQIQFEDEMEFSRKRNFNHEDEEMHQLSSSKKQKVENEESNTANEQPMNSIDSNLIPTESQQKEKDTNNGENNEEEKKLESKMQDSIQESKIMKNTLKNQNKSESNSISNNVDQIPMEISTEEIASQEKQKEQPQKPTLLESMEISQLIATQQPPQEKEKQLESKIDVLNVEVVAEKNVPIQTPKPSNEELLKRIEILEKENASLKTNGEKQQQANQRGMEVYRVQVAAYEEKFKKFSVPNNFVKLTGSQTMENALNEIININRSLLQYLQQLKKK